MTTLITLRPGVTFEAAAAVSWARMEAERGRPLDTNRTTVTRGEQQEKRDDYLRYLAGGPWAPLALDPDDSWHCAPIARAADTDDDEWIREHPDHGWRFVVKSERWHAQYYPHLDKRRGQPASGGSTAFATPTTPREDDVTFICKTPINGANDKNGVHSWICDPAAGTKRNIDFGEYDFLKSLGVLELAGLQSPAITNRYQQIN